MTDAPEGRGTMRAAPWFLIIGMAAAWPIANFVHGNWSQLVADDFTRAAIWWLGVSMLVCAGVAILRRWLHFLTLPQLALTASVAIVLFFWFEWMVVQLTRITSAMSLSGRAAILAYVLIAGALITGILWLTRAGPGRRIVATFIVVGSALSLAQVAVDVLATSSSERPAPVTQLLLPQTHPVSRPNLIMIVVDGYGREDVLRRVAGFDNTPFTEALRQRGFTVLDKALANYPVTYLSVSSLLGADYVALPERTYTTRWRFYDTIQGNNPLVVSLRQLGYRYVHSGNTWGGSSCSGREDFCLNSLERVPTSEFHLELTKMTPLRLLLPELVVSTERGNLDLVIRGLDEVYRKQPVFFFAHTMPPHPPFEWNPDCSRKKQLPDLETWSSPKEYGRNIQCVNRQLLRLADELNRRDPDALVVFISDHGSSFNHPFESELDQWTSEMIAERFPSFVAIKSPARCKQWLRSDLSNVNIGRFVVACIGGVAPEYLPDRFFTAAHERHPDFGHVHEITERVHSLHLH